MIKKLDNETNKPTGYPLVDSNFRAIYSGIALPQLLSPDIVEPLGWCIYESTPMPTPGRYEKAVEGEEVKDEHGVWRQTWTIAEQTDVEKAATDAKQNELVRNTRRARLAFSDWTQLPDAPISAEKKAEWAVYRQALRDITESSAFPWDVTWPISPAN